MVCILKDVLLYYYVDFLRGDGVVAIKRMSFFLEGFIPIPKKGNVKECSNYHIVALIRHASKLVVKILQAKLQ